MILRRGRLTAKRHPIRRKHRPRAKNTRKLTQEPRLWSLKRADTECSLFVRVRDGKCMFPNCTVTDIRKLQASHYHGRAKKSTRYYLDNLDAYCWRHHFKDKLLGMEYQKQTVEKHGWDGQYTLFKKAQLGPERFKALQDRAAKLMNQKAAIMECMQLLSTQEV